MRILEGQSLLDASIQACGSVEGLFSLALANGISITEELPPGRLLEAPSPIDKDIVDYFSTKGIYPVTAITQAQEQEIYQEGIEFWAIEEDFVIS